MSNITITHERAWNAARNVDPMELASALDHIAKTARASRSQTRRVRWIQQRAEFALAGREYRDIDAELPKSAGENTAEKLNRRLAHKSWLANEMLALLQELVDIEGPQPGTSAWADKVHAAIAKATAQ